MAFTRKPHGEPQNYKGHTIIVRHFGPTDFLCEVDGSELSPFYLTATAASKAGMAHVDLITMERTYPRS